MAERLTDKHTVSVYNNSNSEIYLGENEEATKYIYKLAQLEDIMEKYDIEDLDQLDIMLFCLSSETKFQLKQLQKLYKKYKIKNVEELDKKIGYYIDKIDLKAENDYLKKAIEKQNVVTQSISKDRDTWKRACEFLAYEYAEEYFDGRDIEHCFNADKRDKFVKENINRFYQQAKNMEGNDE